VIHSDPRLDRGSEHALTEFIRAERVHFALIQSAIPIFFSPLAAAILARTLWAHVDHLRLVVWPVGLLVLAILRVALIRAFPQQANEQQVRRWERIFVASILAVDLWWGVGALFLLPGAPLAQQAIVFCFVMLMAGGHTASYSAHPLTVLVGVLTLALPITVAFTLVPGSFHRTLAFAAVMFLLAALRSIRTLGHFFGRTHRLAYDLQQEKERVEKLARTDVLTSLHNRRFFYELGADAVARAARYAHSGALLMLDVDHFKAINDAFGHATGDAVIRDLGARIARSVRSTDVAGRLGGEEFAVLLPETALDDALVTAERLRAGVEAGAVEHEGQTVRLTISVGAAELRAGDSLDALIARADAALYAAKHAGRNRVLTAPVAITA
jgi:diguanylate cyclase (GGDEF)-like protein